MFLFKKQTLGLFIYDSVAVIEKNKIYHSLSLDQVMNSKFLEELHGKFQKNRGCFLKLWFLFLYWFFHFTLTLFHMSIYTQC